jgi:hypothetical protein
LKARTCLRTPNPQSEWPQEKRADLSRRLVTAKLCEDGNQMKADGAHPQGGTDWNSFPESILGWTTWALWRLNFQRFKISFPLGIRLLT